MNRRTFLAASAVPAAALTGCNPFPTAVWRFKVSTSGIVDGVFSKASMVYQTTWWRNLVVLPEMSQWEWKREGDALVWDLGKRGVLVGLWWDGRLGGFDGTPTALRVLLPRKQLEGPRAIPSDADELLRAIGRSTARAQLEEIRSPRFVYLSNPSDYRTLRILPPGSPLGHLDFITRFDGFWVEKTSEPISRGIKERIPAIDQLLQAFKSLPPTRLRKEPTPEWAYLSENSFKHDR